jgi:hypothetical protein
MRSGPSQIMAEHGQRRSQWGQRWRWMGAFTVAAAAEGLLGMVAAVGHLAFEVVVAEVSVFGMVEAPAVGASFPGFSDRGAEELEGLGGVEVVRIQRKRRGGSGGASPPVCGSPPLLRLLPSRYFSTLTQYISNSNTTQGGRFPHSWGSSGGILAESWRNPGGAGSLEGVGYFGFCQSCQDGTHAYCVPRTV